MKTLLYIFPLLIILLACRKEVDVNLPEFKQKVVVEGRIEPNMPPIFLLSKTQAIYDETSLQTYFNSLIMDARVFVSDGSTEIELQLFCSNNLPPGTLEIISDLIGIPTDILEQTPFCAYSSLDPLSFGVASKTYTCRIEYGNQVFFGSTHLFPPKALDSLFWKEIPEKPNYGYSHGTYTDDPATYDAYMWEVKRLNVAYNDKVYKKPLTAVFEDIYTNGDTYSFYQPNPFNYIDYDGPEEGYGLFQRGDTVVIRLSKIDKGTFDFENSRIMQLFSNGNPFSSPLNVKSNLTGGCLGLFGAYGVHYDTLVCQ